MICARCGLKLKDEQIAWPLKCSCGLTTFADGSTESRSQGLGDYVAAVLRRLGFKKKCAGCAQRQQKLNDWSRRFWLWLVAVFLWWHPR